MFQTLLIWGQCIKYAGPIDPTWIFCEQLHCWKRWQLRDCSESKEALGSWGWLKGGKRLSPPARSLYHCQQPLSAASFSSPDPAFSFFCLLRTTVFSPLLPVLCSWTTSITRVSEFLARRAAFAACHSLQESLHWLYGRPTHSHAQNSRKDFLVGSQADRVVWLQCG